jgi:hypothetical protein
MLFKLPFFLFSLCLSLSLSLSLCLLLEIYSLPKRYLFPDHFYNSFTMLLFRSSALLAIITTMYYNSVTSADGIICWEDKFCFQLVPNLLNFFFFVTDIQDE